MWTLVLTSLRKTMSGILPCENNFLFWMKYLANRIIQFTILWFLPAFVTPSSSSASLRSARGRSRKSSHHWKSCSQKGLTVLHFRKKCDMESISSQKEQVLESMMRTWRRYLLHGVSLYTILKAKAWSRVSLEVLNGVQKMEGQSRSSDGMRGRRSSFHFSNLEKGAPNEETHPEYHCSGEEFSTSYLLLFIRQQCVWDTSSEKSADIWDLHANGMLFLIVRASKKLHLMLNFALISSWPNNLFCIPLDR